ncbi:MAG: hypothetical protein IJ386_08605 [Clostridia bacterium]|nr:hypothetical protein [Clostridia bacterium]
MIKRIITGLLSLAMIAGTFTVLDIAPASTVLADNSEGWLSKVDEEGEPLINYTTQAYETPQDKLATMELVYEGAGYQLWYEYYTGEVVCIDTTTGQMLWTNPYNVSSTKYVAAAATKHKLLSQIELKYELNGTTYTMLSYNEAAQKGQITMKKIKSGIRVEYAMGDMVTQRLVPRLIEKSRFENYVASKIPETDRKAWERMGCKMIYEGSDDGGFYLFYDINDTSYSERKVLEIIEQFPIAERMAFYVIDPDTSAKELATLESYILKYAPEYTYDELEYDHDLTGYVAKDENPPLFRMALEYTIAEDGLEVRLPANGIRFDESTYKLTSVSVLPWMGCGTHVETDLGTTSTGYTFIPDGSGSLIRFEEVADTVYNVAGDMYGYDFAYHNISGQHAEIMRFPVYGVVSDKSSIESKYVDGKIVKEEKITSEGYVAIITEGDTMASLMSSHGGRTHIFDTVYPSFNPRPFDSYNLADSINIGKSATWTVTSSRKYTGSYRIKYVMLMDDSVAAENGIKDYYEASYVGMAKAYQDYLEEEGIITRLTKDDVDEDIPLYIESFGSIKTADRFLTVPITVDTPLTTFEDVATMYDELTEAGVGKINFRLRGFANGGMKSTVPYKLKWVEAVGGSDGFAELVKYSKDNDFGIFPDFDFAYINDQQNFDGLNLKKHAVRTIDNRYTSKRYYDAASQTFENDFALALSPSIFDYFYENLNKSYAKYEPTGISLSTMGSDLNSDFDEDDPYNREDSKNFTVDFLAKAQENYEVMVDSGNAYTFQNVDHILGMSTESSKYMKASESVPFIGMVLHGYIKTAGTALNMEGDIETALLRAIENGSSLYFIMSYRNTEMLKEDDAYSTYFSVGYETWKDDAIKYYTTVNEVLADLQTSLIVDHEFIDAARVPDADELEADAELEKLEAEIAAAEKAESDRLAALKAERDALRKQLGLVENDDAAEDDEDDTSNEEEITDEEESDEEESDEDEAPEQVVEIEGLGDPKYYTVSGTVVKVEYDTGAAFLLNYNSFDVNAMYNGELITIEALDFVRIG